MCGGNRQDNRIPMGQDLEQVPVVPAGLLAPGDEADLGGGSRRRIDRLRAVWPVRMRFASFRKAMSTGPVDGSQHFSGLRTA